MRVIPYSHTLTAEARTGLDALLARAFGNATVTVDEPVPWGDDDALEWFAEAAGATATACPERIPRTSSGQIATQFEMPMQRSVSTTGCREVGSCSP